MTREQMIEIAVKALAWAPSEHAVDDGLCWCRNRPWKAKVSPSGKDGTHDILCTNLRAVLAEPKAAQSPTCVVEVKGPDDDGLVWIVTNTGRLKGAVSVRAELVAGRAFLEAAGVGSKR